ncbi:hypothetical protein TNCV_1410841 [Trichonephila clavipes]|nr:hypothetical protein TNCV_1410841 [Trichonephila clavipes]
MIVADATSFIDTLKRECDLGGQNYIVGGERNCALLSVQQLVETALGSAWRESPWLAEHCMKMTGMVEEQFWLHR